ncbi:hypothetical protein PUNSTDRAFT_129002 [Punctularia strigosozonata HHB-11173 SS5]|uniref:uncharacterized protein n=1 Tax=Punctularia strigosozonata (strain HHB-11173) TaxID=741275 RepID=UPI00044177B1|nr:uncharacterized protein PUNSTDRAFT_129002 [Punctularia strigosozonata HHB-11173 SS5]EIN13314.1 hypothetical protein PUNSTDRAFT_129002 [Punctularia strigosozonata HHB-11173 SS5]
MLDRNTRSFRRTPADNVYGVAAKVGENVNHVTKGDNDQALYFTFGPNEGRGSQEFALIPTNRIVKASSLSPTNPRHGEAEGRTLQRGPARHLVLDAIGDRQETIAKYSPLAKPGARVAILLPIRYGGRAANNVGSELDEGAFAPGIHNEWFRDHLQPELLPALLEKGLIKPNKIRVVEGSTPLERLQNAIDSLANGAVSGEKLVVRIGED